MAPPALNWKFLGTRNFSGIAGAHDAVAALGALTSYPNGEARNPGTGSAWTWTIRKTGATSVAVTGVPPVNALNFTYILAGETGVAPILASRLAPDTGSIAGCINIGMNRNTTGAYTTWNSATPFTTAGTFSGYWYATRVFAFPYGAVLMWEAQDACIVQYTLTVGPSVGLSSGAVFGAWIDPQEYVVGTTCETDERLYAMSNTGQGDFIPTAWLSTNSSAGGFLGNHATTAGDAHCGYFTPGAATINPARRFGVFSNTNYWPSGQSGSRDGTIVPVPFGLTNVATGAYIGRAREMGVIPFNSSGVGVYDQVGLKGWTTGYATAYASHNVMLKV